MNESSKSQTVAMAMKPTVFEYIEGCPLPKSLVHIIHDNKENPFRKDRFKALYVIQLLTRHEIILKKEREEEGRLNAPTDDYKPLYSIILKRLLTSGKYSMIMTQLKQGYIEVLRNEEGGESYDKTKNQSKRYRLKEHLRKEVSRGEVEYFAIEEKALCKKIRLSQYEQLQELINEKAHLAFELEAITHLQYQSGKASDYLRALYSRKETDDGRPLTASRFSHLQLSHHLLCETFSEPVSYKVASSKHGRLMTNLTHTPKLLRMFITDSEGNELVELDLRSSLWVFFCQALALAYKYGYKDNLRKNLLRHVGEDVSIFEDLPLPELKAFANTVFNHDLYTELGLLSDSTSFTHPSGYTLPKSERDNQKQRALADILFGYHTAKLKNLQADIPQSQKKATEIFGETYPHALLFAQKFAEECGDKKADGSWSKSACLNKLLTEFEGDFFHRRLTEKLQKSLPPESGFFIVHDALFIPQKLEQLGRAALYSSAEEAFGVVPHI